MLPAAAPVAHVTPNGENSLDTLHLKEFSFIVFKSQQLVTFVTA